MEPIAIIGIGCRFPGADGPDEFWTLLSEGTDAISEVPPDRWNVDDLYDADPAVPGKMNTRWGGFIRDVDRFDRDFFGISPREAGAVDPQQRLLLEVAWDALQDAGQVRAALAGSDTGVFVGISTNDYAMLQTSRLTGIDEYSGTGSALSIAANRISYLLDLRGPSLAVDTACSSSLVAVHLACQSLWHGQSRLAVAGGVNVILSPLAAINFTKARVMAPDGRCKTFDARADGYVRGEGAGAVVLKPLSRALADGDPVRAVIRGGAVSQDGRTNGLMAPNRLAQEALLRAAYRHSGIDPREVDYVEAHGTGTALGDQMEATALGTVLGDGRPADRPCIVGAVKSNIGHLEAAAGIAGLIKTTLALEHRRVPASLHVTEPNPRIDFSALRVATGDERWQPGRPVRAGVSSFGFGGTTAHLVLETAPPAADRPPRTKDPVLLALSARTPDALRQVAERHLQVIEGGGDHSGGESVAAAADLADLAYTAAARRTHHRHRLALVAEGHRQAADQLRGYLSGAARAGSGQGPGAVAQGGATRTRKLVFVCSGQGPRWWPLNPALRDEPAVRATLDECDRLIRAEAGWSLLEQLWPADTPGAGSVRLDRADVGQPALFAVQVALANLWRSWGIVPDAVVGHSLGEVAAAHLSGALSLADAVRVVCHRGRLIRTVAGRGAMAVVELSAADAHDALNGFSKRLAVAAVNAPTSTVLSGDPSAIAEITGRLHDRGVFCRVLESVDFASHGPQMEPLTGELATVLDDLRPGPAELPMYSTVTGEPVGDGALDGQYWARNIRQPVLFDRAVAGQLDAGHDVFVELSPHPLLLPSIAQGAQVRGREVVLLPSLRRDEPSRQVLLSSLAGLYATGRDPAWDAVHPARGRTVRLPDYPWQRERCWLPATTGRPGRDGTGHPLAGHPMALAGAAGEYLWEGTIAVDAPAFLDDHRVQGLAVLPGTAWLEMARAAAQLANGGAASTLTDVELHRMLVLDDAGPTTIQLRVGASNGTGASFHAYARPADDARRRPEWTLHATGRIRSAASADTGAPDLDAARTRCRTEISPADFYRSMQARGLEYGPAFRAVEQLWVGDRETLAVLAAPAETLPEIGGYGIHPALLDAGLQVLAPALRGNSDGDDDRPHVPIRIDRVTTTAPGAAAPRRLWAHARVRPAGGGHHDAGTGDRAIGDVTLAGEDGRVVAVLHGVHTRRLDRGVRSTVAAELGRSLYDVRWHRRPRTSETPDVPAAVAGGGWLVFADDGGVGAALMARLAEAGDPVVRVVAGDGYDDTDPDRLVIRADRSADVRRAVAAARVRLGGLRGVVHLWTIDAGTTDAGTTDRLGAASGADVLRAARDRGLVSALHLVQTLAGGTPAPRLWLLTAGAHAIGGSSVSVTQAPIWGLGRVAALEHPELRTTLIDLDPAVVARTDPAAHSPAAAAADWLVGELTADDPQTQLALRDGERHVPRLTRTGASAGPTDLVRADATYAVTGGLGAIGLLVARWLVGRGARRLLLIGRRGPGEAAARVLRELRAVGAEIVVARADVADDRALARVLADTEESGSPLRGVVHAAGILDDATLGTLDPARLTAVLEPKVAGAWNLHRLTVDRPLDFFLLFSSIAGTLGSPGQANYAAGNAFLDALAALRAAQGRPGLSIAWGPWADTGLSVRPDGADRLLASAGVDGLDPDQGVAFLDRLLGLDRPHVAVARVDWARWRTLPGDSSLVADLVVAAGPAAAGRRAVLTADELNAAPAQARQELLEAYLRVEIARVLHLVPERLDADESLNSVGLDSLVAVGIKNQIEVDLGMSVPIIDVLEGMSLRQLATRMLAPTTAGAPPPPPGGDDGWEEFDVI